MMPDIAKPAFVCGLLFSLVTPAVGQEREEVRWDAGDLRGEVSASRVIGSNLRGIDAEEEDSGSSVVLRGSLDYELEAGSANVVVGYDSVGYFYDQGDRPDRWSNRGSIGVTRAVLKNVTLFGQASYASNISTAEAASTDQTELVGRIDFTPDRKHRLQAAFGYRWRTYDFDETEGRGAYYGGQYRYRLGANHYIIGEARREDIQSDNLRRGYERTTAEIFYQRPLADRVRLRAGATARWWQFDGRKSLIGEQLDRQTLTPEIDLQLASRPGWVLRARFQQIFRGSNDPRLAKDQQRLILSAGYRF